jgi:hypothetical protein
MSAIIALAPSAYGGTTNDAGSGTSRTSPTGPVPSTGWSWSSMVMACIARVSPMPLRMRSGSRLREVAFPRTTPAWST